MAGAEGSRPQPVLTATRQAHRLAAARIIELVATPGFASLPVIEQDYLIDLVVCETHGKAMARQPPWDADSLLS